MTKHRTITGFVATALLATLATAAIMRSHYRQEHNYLSRRSLKSETNRFGTSRSKEGCQIRGDN